MKKVRSDYVIDIKKFTVTKEVIQCYSIWFNDTNVLKYLHHNTPYTTDPQVRVTVKQWCDWMELQPFSYLIYIGNKLLGHVAIYPDRKNKHKGAVGIVIGVKSYWHKGVAYRSLKKIIEVAHRNSIYELRAYVQLENLASILLFSKLGFRNLGKIGDEVIFLLEHYT